MTGLIFDLYLGLGAIMLLITGGLITWPVARRIGERNPDPYQFVAVETRHGRDWRTAGPPEVPEPRLLVWWRVTVPLWLAELRDMAHAQDDDRAVAR